ncbi:TESP1 protein, partial [Notiomystis cincta]|nr:TESP1 protein [Notiomystis cincta]
SPHVRPDPAGSPPAPPAMEGPSVLGPSSWQKRHAWARQSRGWRSPAPEGEQEEEEEGEEEEQQAAAVPWDIPEPPPQLNDVVLEGPPSRVRGAGLWPAGVLGGVPECPLSLAACGSSGTSFEDDLALGAEGTGHPRGPRSVTAT